MDNIFYTLKKYDCENIPSEEVLGLIKNAQQEGKGLLDSPYASAAAMALVGSIINRLINKDKEQNVLEKLLFPIMFGIGGYYMHPGTDVQKDLTTAATKGLENIKSLVRPEPEPGFLESVGHAAGRAPIFSALTALGGTGGFVSGAAKGWSQKDVEPNKGKITEVARTTAERLLDVSDQTRKQLINSAIEKAQAKAPAEAGAGEGAKAPAEAGAGEGAKAPAEAGAGEGAKAPAPAEAGAGARTDKLVRTTSLPTGLPRNKWTDVLTPEIEKAISEAAQKGELYTAKSPSIGKRTWRATTSGLGGAAKGALYSALLGAVLETFGKLFSGED